MSQDDKVKGAQLTKQETVVQKLRMGCMQVQLTLTQKYKLEER